MPPPAGYVEDTSAGKPPAGYVEDAASPLPERQPSWLDSAANFAKNAWGELVQQGASMVEAAKHPIEAVKAIGSAQDALRLKAEDAFKRGDYAEGMRHALSYLIPVMGPSIDARGDQAQRGDVSGALGGATTLGLETAAGGVSPENALAAADAIRTAGTATVGAIKGGAKAAVEPHNLLGGGVAEVMAEGAGLPRGVGAAVVAAPRVIAGAVQGARQALQAARVAKAMESFRAAEATPEALGRGPLRPPLAEPNPEAPDIPDFSAGGGGPLRPPLAPAPEAQPIASGNVVSIAPRVPSLAQTEAAMARKSPAETEGPQSQFTATGERKSPQLRAMEIENANRIAKAQRFARALHDQGIEPEDIRQIPIGRFSDAQIAAGQSPGWGNIADLMGEKTPSADTIRVIGQEMKKLKATALAEQLKDEMRHSGTIQ